MNEHSFGEVRALLQAEASAHAWTMLCAELDGWSAAQHERGMAYVADHLERWPDALRVAPTRWIERAAPSLALTRALELDAANPLSAQLERWAADDQPPLITHLSWRGAATPAALEIVARLIQRGPGLRRLELTRGPSLTTALQALIHTAGALQALRVAEGELSIDELVSGALDGLEVLELRGVQLAGELDELEGRVWWEALAGLRLAACGLEPRIVNALPVALRALDLSYNGALGDDGVEALCARRWEALESLDLSGCKVRDAGLWALAACDGMPKLARLALRQNAAQSAGAIQAVERAARFASGCHVETF